MVGPYISATAEAVRCSRSHRTGTSGQGGPFRDAGSGRRQSSRPCAGSCSRKTARWRYLRIPCALMKDVQQDPAHSLMSIGADSVSARKNGTPPRRHTAVSGSSGTIREPDCFPSKRRLER